MLKQIRQSFLFILLGINVLVGIGLLSGAYGQYFTPSSFPLISIAGLAFPIFTFLNLLCLIGWVVVRKKFVWMPILFFLLVGDALLTYFPLNLRSEPEGGTTLKVLTYNVMGLHGTPGYEGKAEDLIVEYLKKSGADIVCLEEVPTVHDKLTSKLKRTYPYSKSLPFENNNMAVAYSKYPLRFVKKLGIESISNGASLLSVKCGNYKLPLIVGHLESNRLNEDDKKVYEDILADPKGKILRSASRHLVGKLIHAAVLRATQADIVAQAVKETNNPLMLVCGDFNDIPLSYTHRVVAEGLQSVYREGAFGPGVTYNSHYMFFRIDHILAGQGYRVLKSKIDRSIKVSDHYPLWCELEIRKDTLK